MPRQTHRYSPYLTTESFEEAKAFASKVLRIPKYSHWMQFLVDMFINYSRVAKKLKEGWDIKVEALKAEYQDREDVTEEELHKAGENAFYELLKESGQDVIQRFLEGAWFLKGSNANITRGNIDAVEHGLRTGMTKTLNKVYEVLREDFKEKTGIDFVTAKRTASEPPAVEVSKDGLQQD